MIKNRKPILGVGVNDWHEPVYRNRKPMKEYQIWVGVLNRCFSKKEKARKPTYLMSSCSSDWLVFSNFVRDLRSMIGYENIFSNGWQLDKDILVKGNKFYSKDTCCLVPKELNTFFIKGDAIRGDSLIGVSERKDYKSPNRFFSTVFYRNKHIHLGCFPTDLEAHLAYKHKKEELIKEYAVSLKGIVDDRVYNALINYTVDVSD